MWHIFCRSEGVCLSTVILLSFLSVSRKDSTDEISSDTSHSTNHLDVLLGHRNFSNAGQRNAKLWLGSCAFCVLFSSLTEQSIFLQDWLYSFSWRTEPQMRGSLVKLVQLTGHHVSSGKFPKIRPEAMTRNHRSGRGPFRSFSDFSDSCCALESSHQPYMSKSSLWKMTKWDTRARNRLHHTNLSQQMMCPPSFRFPWLPLCVSQPHSTTFETSSKRLEAAQPLRVSETRHNFYIGILLVAGNTTNSPGTRTHHLIILQHLLPDGRGVGPRHEILHVSSKGSNACTHVQGKKSERTHQCLAVVFLFFRRTSS